MKNFTNAFYTLMSLEFNSPKDALHKNPNEKGLTFMGIYEAAHPSWQGWGQVRAAINTYGDLEKASVALYNDDALIEKVKIFYKKEFWDKMRLGEVDSELKACELFVFGVNVDTVPAVRVLQRLLGVVVDGIMGAQTLKALNNYDERAFDVDFDKAEITYYRNLVKAKPEYHIYERGWINRAEKV
ncbi:putative peptidoglycan-binding domain-containing protein [Campylobacter concisus]|uniref:putative peptidoglycan-binding domain-containing protein n=1 Tax=Campylobacter concisus TaxID=199 RepID=UPI000D2F9003|nr:putative peptidoglycan-binding domain-containing protein [Campylobacter concisus]